VEESQPNQSNSGSVEIPKLEYNLSPEDRTFAVFFKEMEALKEKVHTLETQKVLAETGLPREVLEENNLLPEAPQKRKRGKGFRPILISEIEEAKKHSVNEAGAARYLKVNYKTYKKYAKLYQMYDPKPSIRGKRNIYDPERGKYPLSEILDGKHPNVSPFRIKEKLIRSGKKKPECENCGFAERRVTDNKVPLLLNFLDDNQHNHSLDNMKLYCLNCTYMCGRGYIRNGKHWFEPEFLQGAEKEDIDEESRY
jgi:hypothetical protein